MAQRKRKTAKKAEVATIESEILAAVPKVKRKSKETEQKFLLRVVKAVSQLDEEDWDELSETAQEWYDNAAEAANEGEDVPEFSASGDSADVEEDEDEDEEDEDEDEDEEDEDEEDEDEEDEDEEDEDEEDEDEDEDEAEAESLEVEDMEKGGYYTIETDEDSFTGECKSISRSGVVTLVVDGDPVKIKEADMTFIEEAEAPKKKAATKRRASGRGKKAAPKAKSRRRGKAKDEDEDEDEDEEEKPKRSRRGAASGEKKTPITLQIKQAIAKFPKSSQEKIGARVSKSLGEDVNESTLKITYRDCHTIIDLLVAEGWTKGK